ncbi:unnamed protein product [Ilex paraguariensis]|uniref:SRP54-type proteins GTP-binding domain-containing protein n=1 Tax=Ilex paraguariensis TaxID=185542 RepID=A0ABC8UBM2_9AQUA
MFPSFLFAYLPRILCFVTIQAIMPIANSIVSPLVVIFDEFAALVTTFNLEIGITGAILTKLDGDSRGGAALSVKERLTMGKPIKPVGRGERMEDLEAFYPDRMAGRILGMGDVLSFVEKAQEIVSVN